MREKKGKFLKRRKVDFTSKRDLREKREILSNKKYWTLKNNVFYIEYKENKNTPLFSLFSLTVKRWLYGKKIY